MSAGAWLVRGPGSDLGNPTSLCPAYKTPPKGHRYDLPRESLDLKLKFDEMGSQLAEMGTQVDLPRLVAAWPPPVGR